MQLIMNVTHGRQIKNKCQTTTKQVINSQPTSQSKWQFGLPCLSNILVELQLSAEIYALCPQKRMDGSDAALNFGQHKMPGIVLISEEACKTFPNTQHTSEAAFVWNEL